MGSLILLLDWSQQPDLLWAPVLEDHLGQPVRILTRGAASLETIEQIKFDLFILEADFVDAALFTTLYQLRRCQPAARWILITSMHPLPPPLTNDLNWQVVLPRPCPMPDLLEQVRRFLGAVEPAPIPAAAVQQPEQAAQDPFEDVVVRVQRRQAAWLQDVNRAAQYLASLSLESSAQAALILKDHQLWASAGHLGQAEMQELAQVASDFWATQPISLRERSQSDLARFISLPVAQLEYMIYATSLAPQLVLVLAFDAATPFSLIRTQANKLARALSSPPPAEARPARPDEKPPQLDSLGLFDAIPPPAPRVGMAPVSQPPAQPAAVVPPPAPVEQAWADDAVPEPEPEQPSAGAALAFDSLEAPTPALAHILYACVLSPRMPHHYLKGDLSLRLGEWLPQLCLAFGWRLEQISIRPEYIQWLVRVSPATSAGYLMRVLRQQTSQRIFTEFPVFSKDNPSGDFWAAGYLVMSTERPIPAEVVRQFIQQTRTHQGVDLSSLEQSGS